jgi:arginine/ornithine N-succinyltransferase beta subunit
MFVMEDTSNGRMAGVCAIKGAVGLDEPFYNYRIGTLVHSSRELDMFTRMDTLYLSNDLTGSTELCSLFLHPDYRTGNNGKWLSKSRFLFIAQFPQLFTEKLIAEMRGYQAEDGSSPFYEGLGRHFFKMDFNHVDDLTALGKKSFIAELMPRQPLYVAYLPETRRRDRQGPPLDRAGAPPAGAGRHALRRLCRYLRRRPGAAGARVRTARHARQHAGGGRRLAAAGETEPLLVSNTVLRISA